MDKLQEKVKWCCKQKRGIKIEQPNENLCSAYIKKSQSSLKSMQLNYREKINDWAIEAAYYARYHIVYALLQKLGIKSEIHECTINLLKWLFKDKIKSDLIKELQTAKQQRINMMYYTDKTMPEEKIKENIEKAPEFIIEIEKIIMELKQEEIQELRETLKRLNEDVN